MTVQPFLLMERITKCFPGGVVANDAVDFSVRSGEIHALIGENGAGKSTLMHILTGIYRQDHGRIVLGGKEINLRSPADAISEGIGMVYQHFMLIPELSVLDNLILGSEPLAGPFLNRKSAVKRINELMERYNMQLPLKKKVRQLSVSAQQQVEILKCLLREADLLILDEPTSVLTPQEARSLFKGLESLVADGKTLIFISHKLGEILSIADRITVLRDGQVTGVVQAEGTDQRELARLMVGREINLPKRDIKDSKRSETDLLHVKDLSFGRAGQKKILDGIDFSLAQGEIVGIAAISGNGQSELVETIVGLEKPTTGGIYLKGTDVTNLDVGGRWEQGLAYIPQDRRGRGTSPWIGLTWNVAIRGYGAEPFSNGFFLREQKIKERTSEIIEHFNVRTSGIDADVNTLSGGNLQKLVVGRELASQPALLIAEDPTQGLDIGSIEQVRNTILAYAKDGGGVLLVSQDLSEILALSDRIIVIYAGKIVGERPTDQFDLEEIGLLMTGLKLDEKAEEVAEDANGNPTT